MLPLRNKDKSLRGGAVGNKEIKTETKRGRQRKSATIHIPTLKTDLCAIHGFQLNLTRIMFLGQTRTKSPPCGVKVTPQFHRPCPLQQSRNTSCEILKQKQREDPVDEKGFEFEGGEVKIEL